MSEGINMELLIQAALNAHDFWRTLEDKSRLAQEKLNGTFESVNLMNAATKDPWNFSEFTGTLDINTLQGSAKLKGKWATDMRLVFNGNSITSFKNMNLINTYLVENFKGCFIDATTADDIENICDWNTCNTIDTTGIFSNMVNLTSIDVSGWNTNNSVDSQATFNNCSSLKVIDIGFWNMSKVVCIDNIFNECSQLISVNINNSNLPSTCKCTNAFVNCPKLKYVYCTYDTFKVIKSVSDSGMSTWQYNFECQYAYPP